MNRLGLSNNFYNLAWDRFPSRKKITATVTAMAAFTALVGVMFSLIYAFFSIAGLHNCALLDAKKLESTSPALVTSATAAVFNGMAALYCARSDLTNLYRTSQSQIDQVHHTITSNPPVIHKRAKEVSSPRTQIQFSPIADRWILDPVTPYYSFHVKEASAHCSDIEARGIQIYQALQENAKTLIFSKSTCLSDQINLDIVKDLMFWNGKIKKRSNYCVYATAFLQSKIPDSYLIRATRTADLPSFYPGLVGGHHQFGFRDQKNELYLVLDSTIPKRLVERYNSVLIVASSQEELDDIYQCVFGNLDYSIHKTTEEKWQRDHGFPRDQILTALELDLDPEC